MLYKTEEYRSNKNNLKMNTELTSFIFVTTRRISNTIALRLRFKISDPNSYVDSIGIIGASPAGIHMAYLLKKKGFTNVEVLENSDRIGGKSNTIMHCSVPQEMGICYLSPDYEKNIIELVNKFVSGDLIDLVSATHLIDNSTNFLSVEEYAMGYGAKVLRTRDIISKKAFWKLWLDTGKLIHIFSGTSKEN